MATHHPHWLSAQPDDAAHSAAHATGMDPLEFAHLTYGELVKQFGRDTTHTFTPWDKLPEAEREKWVSAFAVIHGRIFPHGPPDTERYKTNN